MWEVLPAVAWTIAAAARKPKAILCEKPMADTLGRAEEMLVACRRNKVKLVIAHQRRFLPAYTLARDLIAELARLGAEGGIPVEVRIGVHTGPVVGGVIGSSRLAYELFKDAAGIETVPVHYKGGGPATVDRGARRRLTSNRGAIRSPPPATRARGAPRGTAGRRVPRARGCSCP